MNKLTHEDYLDIKAGSEDGNFTLAWARKNVPILLAYISQKLTEARALSAGAISSLTDAELARYKRRWQELLADYHRGSRVQLDSGILLTDGLRFIAHIESLTEELRQGEWRWADSKAWYELAEGYKRGWDNAEERLQKALAKSEERRALLAAVQWHTALGADESRCVGCGEWASMGCTTDCRFYYALSDNVLEHEHRWVAPMETYVDFEHGEYYFKLADSNTWRSIGGWDSPIPANVFCADCRITADQVKITMSL